MNDVRISYESRRGCGFRAQGGLYLVSGELSQPCGALPLELDVCPTCQAGVKPTRGWTWVQTDPLLRRAVFDCTAGSPGGSRYWAEGWHCSVDCSLGRLIGPPGDQRHGLLWIGEQFYPTTGLFALEARQQGVSRRIPALPNGFELGTTWVLLAHRKAIPPPLMGPDRSPRPGIFSAFCPVAVEKVVSEEEARDAEAMQKLRDRGIEPVIVRRKGEEQDG